MNTDRNSGYKNDILNMKIKEGISKKNINIFDCTEIKEISYVHNLSIVQRMNIVSAQ